MKGKIYKKQLRRGGVSYWTVVELPADPITGERRQRKVTASTRREVEARVSELLGSMQVGTFVEPDTQRLTFTQYLERWLPSIQQSIKPASYRVYSDLMRNHAEPSLGKKLLTKITGMDIELLYTDRLAGGLSPSTVEMLHTVLHKAFKQAIRWKLVQRNVTEDVEVPRGGGVEYTTWNEKQVSQFLAVTASDELAALWRMTLLTGMRRGEILGLKWADLDLEGKRLTVRRTYSRGEGSAFALGSLRAPGASV